MAVKSSCFSRCTIISAARSKNPRPNAARMDSKMRIVPDPGKWLVVTRAFNKRLKETIITVQYGEEEPDVVNMRETVYRKLIDGTYHISACPTALVVMDKKNCLLHPAMRDVESGTIVVF